MYLKELDLGHETKCTCGACEGTGICKGFAEYDDLGVICERCKGKGYYTLELNENLQLVQDEKTGAVYKVNGGLIVDSVSLFNGLQKRDDVNYVMYSTGNACSPEYLFEHGANKINVIRYKEFIQGKLPLPMEQYTCPKKISYIYGDSKFDNDCILLGSFSNCKKYGTQECWDKFYGEAKTVEEKQNVLKKIR